MIHNKYMQFTFRLLLGGVFIWTGLLKIIDPLEFAQSIANYRIFPRWLVFLLALILPWIELICGVCLILGLFQETSTVILSGLLISFLIIIILTIFRGIDIDCGCFGAFSRKVDFRLLLTDAVLLFLALSILLSKMPGKPKLEQS